MQVACHFLLENRHFSKYPNDDKKCGISFQEWLHHRCLERPKRLQMTQPQNAKIARLLFDLFHWLLFVIDATLVDKSNGGIASIAGTQGGLPHVQIV